MEFSRNTGGGKWNSFLSRTFAKAKKSVDYMLWQSKGVQPSTRRKLWLAKCQPILEYASEIWHGEISPSWASKLQSLHAHVGTSSLRVFGSPANVGIDSEMDLQPLVYRRDVAKLRYWKKLCATSQDRLLGLIFVRRQAEVMSGGALLSNLWSMREVFSKYSLLDHWRSNLPPVDWDVLCSSKVDARVIVDRRRLVSEKTSLALYSKLGLSESRVALPLCDNSNPKGTRLKSAARLGQLFVLKKVARILGADVEDGVCWLCGLEEEDIQHFLVRCPVLATCRARCRLQLCSALVGTGAIGDSILNDYDAGGLRQLRIILANVHQSRDQLDALVNDVALEQVAYANWCVDKKSKNYLCTIWKVRESVVGRQRIVSGALVTIPVQDASKVLLQQLVSLPSRSFTLCWATRRRWGDDYRKWCVRKSRDDVYARRSTGKRFPFYVVWCGRQVGVFYKWSDCWRSVANFEGRKFCGARSLDSAYQMFYSDLINFPSVVSS